MNSTHGAKNPCYYAVFSRFFVVQQALGNKVKQIRKLHNLNQVDFSNALGISQGRLSEIEQDKTKPSADTIIALRQVFNVDLNWLMSINSKNKR